MKTTCRSDVPTKDDIIGRHSRAHIGRSGFARAKRRRGAGYYTHQLEIRFAAAKALNRLRNRARGLPD